MKMVFRSLAILMTGMLLLGMGSLGGVPEGTIPEVEQNFSARITDRDGVVTAVSHFSVDGNTFLTGARGQGQVTIQFGDLNRLEFGTVAPGDVPVRCTLNDGTEVDLRIRRRSVFYGRSEFGAFQIHARHIRRIVLPDPVTD